MQREPKHRIDWDNTCHCLRCGKYHEVCDYSPCVDGIRGALVDAVLSMQKTSATLSKEKPDAA